MAKKQITIRIHRAANKELYFTINGANGKVIVTSETYKRRQGVDRAIDTLLFPFAEGPIGLIDESGENPIHGVITPASVPSPTIGVSFITGEA